MIKIKLIFSSLIVLGGCLLINPPSLLAQNRATYNQVPINGSENFTLPPDWEQIKSQISNILQKAGLSNDEIKKINEGLNRANLPVRDIRLLIEGFNAGRINPKDFASKITGIVFPKLNSQADQNIAAGTADESRAESNEKETPWLEIIGSFIAISGFVAGIIRYYVIKKKKKSVSNYFSNIDDTYSNFKMKSRRCEAELYRLQDMIAEDFKNHKIDESSFALLEQRINNYLQEIRQQILADSFGGLPMSIKSEVTKMFGDKTIDKGEYKSFLNKLKSSDLDETDKTNLKNLIQEWEKSDASRSASKGKKN